MAKFVTTTEISFTIEAIIREAKKFLILVSPYLNIHVRLKKVIEQKLKENDSLIVIIVCRTNEIKKEELRWLQTQNIEIANCSYLHAKCYLNENTALITSMNLYEYSAVNNVEYGFKVVQSDDATNYKAIIDECLVMVLDTDRDKIENLFSTTSWMKSLLDLKNSGNVALLMGTDLFDIE